MGANCSDMHDVVTPDHYFGVPITSICAYEALILNLKSSSPDLTSLTPVFVNNASTRSSPSPSSGNNSLPVRVPLRRHRASPMFHDSPQLVEDVCNLALAIHYGTTVATSNAPPDHRRMKTELIVPWIEKVRPTVDAVFRSEHRGGWRTLQGPFHKWLQAIDPTDPSFAAESSSKALTSSSFSTWQERFLLVHLANLKKKKAKSEQAPLTPFVEMLRLWEPTLVRCFGLLQFYFRNLPQALVPAVICNEWEHVLKSSLSEREKNTCLLRAWDTTFASKFPIEYQTAERVAAFVMQLYSVRNGDGAVVPGEAAAARWEDCVDTLLRESLWIRSEHQPVMLSRLYKKIAELIFCIPLRAAENVGVATATSLPAPVSSTALPAAAESIVAVQSAEFEALQHTSTVPPADPVEVKASSSAVMDVTQHAHQKPFAPSVQESLPAAATQVVSQDVEEPNRRELKGRELGMSVTASAAADDEAKRDGLKTSACEGDCTDKVQSAIVTRSRQSSLVAVSARSQSPQEESLPPAPTSIPNPKNASFGDICIDEPLANRDEQHATAEISDHNHRPSSAGVTRGAALKSLRTAKSVFCSRGNDDGVVSDGPNLGNAKVPDTHQDPLHVSPLTATTRTHRDDTTDVTTPRAGTKPAGREQTDGIPSVNTFMTESVEVIAAVRQEVKDLERKLTSTARLVEDGLAHRPFRQRTQNTLVELTNSQVATSEELLRMQQRVRELENALALAEADRDRLAADSAAARFSAQEVLMKWADMERALLHHDQAIKLMERKMAEGAKSTAHIAADERSLRVDVDTMQRRLALLRDQR